MVISNESYLSVMADFFNAQLALSKTLAEASLECSEELININVTAVKIRVAESTVFTQRLMTAKDPYERLALISSRLQARVGGALLVAQRIANVTVNAQSQVSDAVKQQMEALKRKTSVEINAHSGVPTATLSAVHDTQSVVVPMAKGGEQINQAAEVIQFTQENQEQPQTGTLGAVDSKTAVEVISTKPASEQKKSSVAQAIK